MMQVYRIPGKFLGRNESEKLARSHWAKANEIKRDETEASMLYAKQAGLEPVSGPVDLLVMFREQVEFYKNGRPKKMRDVDNVISALKPILDGLTKAGVLPDDGPKWVRRVIPSVQYAEDDPHITVAITDYLPERTVTFLPVELPGDKEE